MTKDTLENSPDLWLSRFPWPNEASHKYSRGHAVIAGGEAAHAGAARMAARAALRVGAGLVSVACSSAALPIYASALEAVMTKVTDDANAFRALVSDTHVVSVLVGPGCGVADWTRVRALAALDAGKKTVLDADAISLFQDNPDILFSHIKSPCILTPHEGEFARLFSMINVAKSREERAAQAAALSHAVVVLKGHQTVIAAPDGRIVVNKNATPFLATAGSGDVLAGLCVGLLAQGMEVFDAACAAVWIHGAAGSALGAGLTAEDLPEAVPAVLHMLSEKSDIT